ncbi:MAG: FAD-binding oxidoreductase [Kiloniellales bacterium]
MKAVDARRGEPAMKIRARTKEGDFAFSCEPGERILYAGLRNGVPLPYECATGTCGTCKARGNGAAIDELWREAPGRSFLKPERGEFLMCQSVSGGSCEIEVPARLQQAPMAAITPDYRRGRISGIRRLTHDVIFFELGLERTMRYHPGQFVVMRAPGVEGFRAYSMVNHEAETDFLQFVVKRKPHGAFCDWLFGWPAEGTEVEIFGPLGRAVFDPAEGKNLLAIAGGSGIAGIMAILARARQGGYFAAHKGAVFFGVRGLADGFFLDELADHVAAAAGNLSVTVALSHEDPPGGAYPGYPSLAAASGFVHVVAAQSIARHRDNAVAFVAGPPPMVDGALRMLIIEARLPAGDIRYDKFG